MAVNHLIHCWIQFARIFVEDSVSMFNEILVCNFLFEVFLQIGIMITLSSHNKFKKLLKIYTIIYSLHVSQNSSLKLSKLLSLFVRLLIICLIYLTDIELPMLSTSPCVCLGGLYLSKNWITSFKLSSLHYNF